MKESALIKQARRELAQCEKDINAGIHREVKGAELSRRRALIAHEKTRPLYLIACSGSKLDKPAKARDLYQGQAFKFAMEAAARAGADVLILSALHGAVDPDAVLNPYNVTLSDMTQADRQSWAQRTAAELEPHQGRAVTVLAGANYAAACINLDAAYPLAGLGIGQQLAALKNYNKKPEQAGQPQQLALELN